MPEVETKTVEPQSVVSLSFTGPYDQTEDVLDELMGWLMRAGHPYCSHPFAVFYDDPDEVPEDELRAEVCLPIAERIKGDEEVDIKEIPGGEVAYTLHQGSYDDIVEAYDRVFTWLEEEGLEFHEEMGTREVFLKLEGEVDIEEELLTEIQVPLATEEEEEETAEEPEEEEPEEEETADESEEAAEEETEEESDEESEEE